MDEQNYTFPPANAFYWQAAPRLAHVEPQLKSWLQNTGSLTEALLLAGNHFRVQLLAETFVPQQQCWYRDVLLWVDQQPWVLARTEIPKSLWLMPTLGLAHLADTPIGALLHESSRFRHQPFEFSPVFLDDQQLWARKRAFYYLPTQHDQQTQQKQHQQPIVVHEIFLPANLAYLSLLESA